MDMVTEPQPPRASLLHEFRTILQPLTLTEHFPTPQPLEVELGCGDGSFLVEWAQRNPGRNLLGVERLLGRIRKPDKRGRRAGLTNLNLVRIEIGYFLEYLLPPASTDALHVYFPDPWWKARHRKRRVLSELFLRHAGRVLPAGATLHVWTDVEEYFRESMAFAQATGLFADPREEQVSAAEHDLDYRTHFERRTRLAHEPVWRAALDRTERPADCERLVPPEPLSP